MKPVRFSVNHVHAATPDLLILIVALSILIVAPYPPPDRGLWSARKVAQWIAGMLGRLVPVRSALNYLHRLNFTRQVPRPRHVGADWVAQTTFKARFRARMQDLLHAEPERALEVWAFDEHRAGLKPVSRDRLGPARTAPDRRGTAPLPMALCLRLRPAQPGRGGLVPG